MVLNTVDSQAPLSSVIIDLCLKTRGHARVNRIEVSSLIVSISLLGIEDPEVQEYRLPQACGSGIKSSLGMYLLIEIITQVPHGRRYRAKQECRQRWSPLRAPDGEGHRRWPHCKTGS